MFCVVHVCLLLLFAHGAPKVCCAPSTLVSPAGGPHDISNTILLTTMASQQEPWWQLANESWHDDAFWRFMMAGPPLIAFNTSFLPQSGLPIFSFASEFAIMRYQLHQSFSGVGTVNVTTLVSLFQCLNPSDCVSLAPLVVAREYSSQIPVFYATVWQSVFSSYDNNPLFMNAPLSALRHLHKTPLALGKSGGVTYLSDIPPCPVGTVQRSRMLLGTAYGETGIKCARRRASDLNATGLGLAGRTTMLVLRGGTDQLFQYFDSAWEDVDMNNCSSSPYTTLFNQLQTCVYIVTYATYTCINLDYYSCSQIDYPDIVMAQLLDLADAIQKHQFGTANKYIQQIPLPPAYSNMTSCSNVTLEVIAQLDQTETSDWVFAEGKIQHSPSNQQSKGSFCFVRATRGPWVPEGQAGAVACTTSVDTLGVAGESGLEQCQSSQYEPLRMDQIINLQLQEFAKGHVTAMNDDLGGSTGVWAALGIIVPTLVSTILLAQRITDAFILACIHRLGELDLGHSKVMVVLFLWTVPIMLLTVVLMFAPAMSLAYKEYRRSFPYFTWNVLVDDVSLNSLNTQAKIVLFMHGVSKYDASVIYVVPAVMVFCVASMSIIAYKRCRLVSRYKKLLDIHYPETPSNNKQAMLLTSREVYRLKGKAGSIGALELSQPVADDAIVSESEDDSITSLRAEACSKILIIATEYPNHTSKIEDDPNVMAPKAAATNGTDDGSHIEEGAMESGNTGDT